MSNLSRTLAIALEGVGCSAVIAGIAIEVTMHADLGYIVITSGSLVVAAGAMIFAKFVKWKK